MNILIKSIVIASSLLFLLSCQKEDSNSKILKRKNVEPNLNKRAETYVNEGGGVLN